MKVASYFCELFSLVFISFGFKLHKAAKVNIIVSTCCIILTGMDLQISYFLCLSNLRICHLAFHSCIRWTNQSAKMKKQIFLNLKASVCHYFIIPFKNILKTSGDKPVACLNRITRREEQNKHSGFNSNQNFKCIMVLDHVTA